jgi:hypothetical protein
MAIPKKGSRPITIQGLPYRWRVRGRPTYFQGMAWKGLVLAVERSDASGAILLVQLDRHHPSNWMEQEASPVTPADVGSLIQRALSSGWRPEVPGRPFMMDLREPLANLLGQADD